MEPEQIAICYGLQPSHYNSMVAKIQQTVNPFHLREVRLKYYNPWNQAWFQLKVVVRNSVRTFRTVRTNFLFEQRGAVIQQFVLSRITKLSELFFRRLREERVRARSKSQNE